MKYTLSELYRAGIISEKPRLYLDIAEKVNELKALHIKRPSDKVAKDMQISIRTVARAIRVGKRLDDLHKRH